MQKRVVEQGEAERTEPSWYLTRDGKQFGPLTDRELSLFAEGGNFKTGDLLWTEGLDSWKPADAIFGLGSAPEADTDATVAANGKGQASGEATDAPVFVDSSPAGEAELSFEPDGAGDASFTSEANGNAADAKFGLVLDDPAHAVTEPNGEDVDALVQALHASAVKPKPTLKERVIEEAKKFAGIFVYLWVVFTALLLIEWIALAEHHIGFTFYGLAAINAVLLAKIMMIADHTSFAGRLKGMPLVYPIVYKAAAFTTLLFVAYVLEKMLIGGITGSGFLASVPDIGGGLMGSLALWLVFCLALIPYFAYREIERAVGPEMFRRLLLGNLPTRR